LDIGEVARRSGIPASALRYYEKLGLIRSIGRAGARRVFATDVLWRLSLISLGRAAGLLLEEIGGMLPADGSLQIDRSVLAARADRIDATIRQLTAMRDGLRHAAVCKHDDHLACPRFQRLLQAAAKRRAGEAAPVKRKQ
jgi:DNA-binding transcriptional MerR regulator